MSVHEKRCTRNPHRICGFHKEYIQEPQKEIEEILEELIPKIVDINRILLNNIIYDEDRTLIIQTLLEITSGCPACVLATIKQSPFLQTLQLDFDYQSEVNLVFEDYKDTMNYEAQQDALYD